LNPSKIDKHEIRAEIALGMLIQGTDTLTQIESGIEEATERVMRIIEREERGNDE
jgi:hypothetical protein